MFIASVIDLYRLFDVWPRHPLKPKTIFPGFQKWLQSIGSVGHYVAKPVSRSVLYGLIELKSSLRCSFKCCRPEICTYLKKSERAVRTCQNETLVKRNVFVLLASNCCFLGCNFMKREKGRNWLYCLPFFVCLSAFAKQQIRISMARFRIMYAVYKSCAYSETRNNSHKHPTRNEVR